jgi:ABC-2 type transport system permease protein
MKKLFTVIKKEYKDVVKKKTFIITTILTPVLMGAFVFIPGLLMKVAKTEKTIEVADYSNFIISKLKNNQETGISFKLIENPNQDLKNLVRDYEAKILSKESDALLIIPEDIKKNRAVYYYARNISDIKSNRFLSSEIERLVSEQILIEKSIAPDIIEEATRKIKFETFKVKKEGTKKSSFSAEYMLSILMMTILFSVIMTYGTLLMRNVVAEKNNRIMEILISSTNSHTLFYGKILGLALAGLTQVGIWMAFGFILINSFAFKIVKNISDFISLEFCIYFVIFFLLGYLMYSILFAIVGASVNTDEEAQQLASPVIYVLIVPFMIGILVTQAPDIPIVAGLSLFPLFSPTLMFMRISVVTPPFYQILISIVLSIFTIFLMAWIGAKIFRIGILMYGKKPSIKEIMKWLRYK